MTWLTMEEQTRLALLRKRRLRLIYKFRHGLKHTHQPKNRDRGKLERLAAYEAMRVVSVPGPIGDLLRDRIEQAERQFQAAVAVNMLFGSP